MFRWYMLSSVSATLTPDPKRHLISHCNSWFFHGSEWVGSGAVGSSGVSVNHPGNNLRWRCTHILLRLPMYYILHVSEHQSREEGRRAVSELMPPSRWHLGNNLAGRRETEREKHSVCEKRGDEWSKSGARKNGMRLRRIPKGYSKKSYGCKGVGREQGKSSWERITFAHFLSIHERHSLRRGDTEDVRERTL